MDKFEDLQAFVAVVEAGSFTAAADRLKSAKSAVSRRVSALEERLGVQLLRRTTRVLNLTETGSSFYEHSARILADLNEAEAAVQQEHGELRGTLRVALPLSFGVRHMCKPIAAFSKLHPKVEFDLNLNDRRIDLIEEGIDVALRIGRLQDSSHIARRLFDVHTVICASPHYLKVHGEPQTPADLSDHRCLVYSNLTDPNKWAYVDDEGNKRAIDIDSVMSASSGDFLANAAAHGMGIVMQPTFIAAESIRRGNLVPILTDHTWPISPAYAIYPPTRHLSYRVRAFIDFLVERFSGTPQWDRECEAITMRKGSVT
ncbi:MAG: LysR family transcriptional regulator [Gammaproteobacteria bacterium]|nr:LysR family transcriptional regulator [Gammaproteobacteria bacterium]MBT8110378.1 LysR family transcriptional regulator [Gammaproteobacteria bacterium]NNC57613.1 LysR family transcriptional regulator [Woeseiaceae bacterium]NNL45081.1 LysR family transcriptional regulator [Woeseiaceae bacterium]